MLPTPPSTTTAAPLTVSVSHIRKTFGSLVALDDVSVTIRGGSIHGLLGENGAGKSTLMNVLYGLIRPDAGTVSVAGMQRAIRSPQDAIAAGVGMVHQHFMLAGAMSVLDNILLGDRRAPRWLDRRAAAERLVEMSRALGLPIDPAARAGGLSVGQQQRVEILKALFRDVRVLILDEPTAVLTPLETEQLFAAVTQLRDHGHGVIFISHKLREVKGICDDLTVLRRGRVVWEGKAADVDTAELSRHMVGRDVAPVSIERAAMGDVDMPHQVRTRILPSPGTPGEGQGGGLSAHAGPPPLPPPHADPHLNPPPEYQGRKLESATTHAGPAPLSATPPAATATPRLELHAISTGILRDVSLHILPGEILGIAGVDGNGQQELAEAVVGLRAISAGSIAIDGRDITRLSLLARQRFGIAHIPNDRKLEGMVASMTVAENIALKRHGIRPFARAGFVRWGIVRRTAAALVERFDVRTSSVDTPMGTLSGGNQQKVILARELALTETRLIVAMNPVRGLDIAATAFVFEQLVARRAAGCAILLINSELDELLALCDRIAVLYNGRLTESGFPAEGIIEIGKLMTGG